MTPRSRRNGLKAQTRTAERARQYLSGGGVTREDSDDELGIDDHPWEWIFEEAPAQDAHDLNFKSDISKARAVPSATKGSDVFPSGKTEPSPRNVRPKRQIIGARMGAFECKVGDCVLLKAEGTNEAWVGLICNFQEEERDHGKAANFMWFSTQKEIRNKQKKRTDSMQNELYITPSWDLNPLASINGKASIVSAKTFLSRFPAGKVPKYSKENGKIFVCRRGCNTRTATYTEEFDWEDIYGGSQPHVYALVERIKKETKATRKPRGAQSSQEHEMLDWIEEDAEASSPRTPKHRRKLTFASTPNSKTSIRNPLQFTTPTHRRVMTKKPLEFTPLGTRLLSPGHVSSPFQIARSKLHVSSVPSTLPCREHEFATVYSHLEAAISDGSGSCIYISGTPGTGKTATVREVVAQLNASVLAEELDDFIFVEINGMKVTDPHQSYSLLWEALRGDRVSSSHALDLLEREFCNPNPRRVPCVVLMDELDQLVTKNQSVMYNLFNWPGLRHSRLIVLAVANTMDLPERTLSNKISSRLGLTRITFPGYTHEQLMKIIQSRLEGVPGNIVESDAIQFASRKVAAVSGDARRALDICRRAVEIAEMESAAQDSLPPTPSKKAKPDPTSSRGLGKRPGTVTISTIKQAINEATTSPLQQYLRHVPLSSKLFLSALLARTRRTGISESVLSDIVEEAKRIGNFADDRHIRDFLLTEAAYPNPEMNAAEASKMMTKAPRVLAMGGAAMELMEAGIIDLEARKGERTGKIRLHVGEEEITLAFKEDPEVRGLGFSS
ncbi:MAG: Origin recognition complex, subunit 1 [Pleopsidium flavum]|nr:MAG: Origin recognition complex, subunit 1 [Pleopsidium flavum]